MPENNFDSNEKFLLKLSSFSLLELAVTLLKEGFFTDIYLEISQTIRKSFLRITLSVKLLLTLNIFHTLL